MQFWAQIKVQNGTHRGENYSSLNSQRLQEQKTKLAEKLGITSFLNSPVLVFLHVKLCHHFQAIRKKRKELF